MMRLERWMASPRGQRWLLRLAVVMVFSMLAMDYLWRIP